MDRLVLETTLSEVNEIILSEAHEGANKPAVILDFKATHTDHIVHAFSALKGIANEHEIGFVICKTMVTGMYDLEIKTHGLDEPIRIMNRPISTERIHAIQDLIDKNEHIYLGTNVSGTESWIPVHTTTIKDCELKH